MEDAIDSIKQLVWEYQNVIPNAEFIIELLELILKNSLMSFDGEYFQQIFGVIMGTNVEPILANIYMAKLENLLKEKAKQIRKLFGLFCLKDLLMMVLESRRQIKMNLNIGFMSLIC